MKKITTFEQLSQSVSNSRHYRSTAVGVLLVRMYADSETNEIVRFIIGTCLVAVQDGAPYRVFRLYDNGGPSLSAREVKSKKLRGMILARYAMEKF